MVSTGWMTVGKTVVYPVRPGTPETAGLPLINWVAEIERPEAVRQDWTGRGKLADMMPAFAGLTFDWLDISGMIESTEEILEYPMVDRDPLPRWTFGRITLLGDAAHPMYPRGSNGAAQAIIDARTLTQCLQRADDEVAALQAYEQARRAVTAGIVLTNRTQPPDYLISAVDQRSGGKPVRHIDDVISQEELRELSERYKKVAGFALDKLK
jgi:2-polyprenyl-6-methoxyphenol hydroxylase-like FAD-dependent oxidoreductase